VRWAEEEAGAEVARVTGKCRMWYNNNSATAMAEIKILCIPVLLKK